MQNQSLGGPSFKTFENAAIYRFDIEMQSVQKNSVFVFSTSEFHFIT